jgi:hypothetical protein
LRGYGLPVAERGELHGALPLGRHSMICCNGLSQMILNFLMDALRQRKTRAAESVSG